LIKYDFNNSLYVYINKFKKLKKIKNFKKKKKKKTGQVSPTQPVSPSYTGRVVIIGPFLFDGPAQPGPFLPDNIWVGPKRDMLARFATPS